jgi:peptidoglycan hydrolase CwlO-like protein
MKWNYLIAASVAALLLTTACNQSSSNSATGTASVSEKGVDVDVSYQKRDDWVAKMKREASDLNAEIDRLAKDGSAEAKTKAETLKDKSKNLNVEIDKVQNATASTWEDVKASSSKAMDDAKSSFRDAKDWVARKLQEAGQKLESK